MAEWNAEDDKIVTLARAGRARIQATSGAALRDTTGRTYSSANVNIESLVLSAVELVVGQAIASGAEGIEAVVVCSDAGAPIQDHDLAVIRGFGGSGIPVHHVGMTGDVLATQLT
jgi:hypothetical protein